MRVVLVHLGHGPELTSPEALLDEYHSLTGWAEGLAAAGAELDVVQGFHRDARLERGGVRYHFLAGAYTPHLSRRRVAWRAVRTVRRLAPDVAHLNGLLFFLTASALRAALPRSSALVAQHHAERPERGLPAAIQRWGLRAVDGFFFSGLEMAAPWRERGLLGPRQPVFEILEGSTGFRLGDREAARAATGMRGDPACVSVANLKPGKDPLIVLDGFRGALAELPDARLYLIYREQELLPQVRDRLAQNPRLSRAVELVGAVPHPQVERYLNGADLFVSGSRYEGSGYALVEALACGAVPVVSDIPAFRYITGGGEVGALWEPGSPEALSRALVDAAQRPFSSRRRAARAFFEDHLSYESIGRQAMAAYRRLRELRR